MKILVVSQYFWPESFPISDLVRTLHEQGHDVVVATGKPNYPRGEIYPGYSADGVQRELFAGAIDVIRIPMRPRGRGNALNLFRNYLSFAWSGVHRLPWLLRGRSLDAILVYCPSPITSAIPAIPLKWAKRAHLAIWVQDLWPQSLEATGYIRSPLAIRAVGWLVSAIYAAADTLLLQSHAFREGVSRYAAAGKSVYYPNSLLTPGEADDSTPIPVELLRTLEQYFCIVFAGNMGTAQAMDTILDAAVLLRDCADTRIVLVGSGSRLESVMTSIQSNGLANVIVAGQFPSSAMPRIYARASGLLVTLADHEIFALTVPSKLQAYLAAGRPIIASLNGEGARVVQAAQAGICCAAEDGAGLAESILQLRAMSPADRTRLGENGRRYFQENFEMKGQAARLVEILKERTSLHNGSN